jgi:hypothetical protein
MNILLLFNNSALHLYIPEFKVKSFILNHGDSLKLVVLLFQYLLFFAAMLINPNLMNSFFLEQHVHFGLYIQVAINLNPINL